MNESPAIQIDDLDRSRRLLGPQPVATNHGGGKLGLGHLPRALAEDSYHFGCTHQGATRYFALLRVFEVRPACACEHYAHDKHCQPVSEPHDAPSLIRKMPTLPRWLGKEPSNCSLSYLASGAASWLRA